jgi:hypothetical protein
VRLDAIDEARLVELVTDAWRCRAPARVVSQWEADPAGA